MPRYNEAALAYVFNDVTYIQTEIGRLDRPGLDHVFDEVKLVSTPRRCERSERPTPLPAGATGHPRGRRRRFLARRKRAPKPPREHSLQTNSGPAERKGKLTVRVSS